MTKAKAREIVAQAERGDPVKNYQHESFCEAKGYLEAIEKAKGLVEALKQINDEAYAKTLDTVQLENWLIVMTEKALAKWEKTK